MCLQFFNHLISSPPSNSYKQTAQLSGESPTPSDTVRSSNLFTGRNSRIRSAEIGGLSVIRTWESDQSTSVSMKSERPRNLKSTNMRFLMKPRIVSVRRKRFGKNTSVYPTGKPMDFRERKWYLEREYRLERVYRYGNTYRVRNVNFNRKERERGERGRGGERERERERGRREASVSAMAYELCNTLKRSK
ncbi:hypothetical protein O6P43_027259 [Quillaja saponaria]|uniref:Uncharacterized protein n=1 Tax=Quillaja saponaria TaxID=32244 RepID=A0AAD7L4C9_QUISA|nr:hypothetical protein O6P43_027259 [Quillaja saponaria]